MDGWTDGRRDGWTEKNQLGSHKPFSKREWMHVGKSLDKQSGTRSCLLVSSTFLGQRSLETNWVPFFEGNPILVCFKRKPKDETRFCNLRGKNKRTPTTLESPKKRQTQICKATPSNLGRVGKLSSTRLHRRLAHEVLKLRVRPQLHQRHLGFRGFAKVALPSWRRFYPVFFNLLKPNSWFLK